MKIEKKDFQDFIKKIKMSKDLYVAETLLKFEEDGLHIKGAAASNIALAVGHLKKEAFTDYAAIGVIGLSDLDNFEKVIDRFGKEIELKVEGNLLNITEGGKSVGIELTSEKFFADKDTPAPNLSFDEYIDISSGQMKEIMKDAQMSRDAQIIIETVEKGARFTNTGKYKFTTNIESEGCKGGAKVKIGDAIINALYAINSDLKIGVKTDYPIQIEETNDKMSVKYIIAPRVENNK